MTLSKERLEHYATLPSQPFQRGASVFMYEVRQLARELLERRERDKQEPVISVIFKDGWPIPETVGIVAGSEKLPDGAHEFYAAQPAPVATAMTRDKIREIFMNNGFTIKAGQTDLKEYVYAAASELISFVKAPAPVVPPLQVPDAISVREAIANMESHEYCDTINVAYRHGWNDCRAAMLQSFDNSEQLNSPVAPDDERAPRPAYKVKSFGEFKARKGSQNNLETFIECFSFDDEDASLPDDRQGFFVPKFMLQGVINKLQEHCDMMSDDPLEVIMSITASRRSSKQESE